MFMNYKLLRYSLLSMLFMLCGSWAQAAETEVELDFTSTEEITAMGFALPESGKGTDITEAFTYKNITITPYKGTSHPRIWNSNGDYTFRYYKADSEGNKGGFSVSVPTGNVINKIVITGNTQLQYTTANAGTIVMASDNKTLTWTPGIGNALTTVKFENGGSSTTNVGTITVTYEATGGDDPVSTVDYYLTGSFNGWATDDANYKFTENASSEGEYMLQNVVFEDDDFEAGAVEFKVVSSAGNWYPSSNLQINEAGTYNFYFRPDGQGGTDWSEGFIYVQKVESTDPEPEPVATLEDGFYLVGSFNNWTASADYKFAENASNAGEYVLSSISLTAGTEIKAVKVENNAISTWYPSGANYVVKKTGSHDIYFRPNGQGNADWHEGTLYVTNEETTPATEGAFQLTSVSENGTIHFYLGDNEVTEANAGDQIVAVVTPNDGYAIDWSSVQVKAYASFTDAQTPLTNAPGVLQDVEYQKNEEDRTIGFTMPEANVRITVAYTVDKSVLEELITNAEELAGNIEDADIKGALQTAIDNAKDVDQNADATVEEVATATDALNDAMIAALRALDALKVEVTVPAGSYATMFLDKKRALETAVEGVKLYTITAVDVANKQVVLSDELTVIDSQTPFIIANEGNADADIVLAVAAGTPTEVTVAPEFKGTLDAKTFTADDMAAADYYTLHGSNFVWTPDAGTIGANKCWIELPKSGGAPAPSLAIVGGEGTTGINSLTPALPEGEGVYYDLSGRRVAQPTKGLYIINGKKVVLK